MRNYLEQIQQEVRQIRSNQIAAQPQAMEQQGTCAQSCISSTFFMAISNITDLFKNNYTTIITFYSSCLSKHCSFYLHFYTVIIQIKTYVPKYLHLKKQK